MSTGPIGVPSTRTRFVRDALIGTNLERLLVAAVVTILVTRGYLQITGFPQVGGNGLHIAHMLWGGLLMLVSNVLLLAFIGRGIRTSGSVISGVGFGLFIDELGKFITSTNDYFFQPTIAIVYVIFVVLFLVFRALSTLRSLSPEERLANAFMTVRDVTVGHFDSRDIREALITLRGLSPPTDLSTSAERLLAAATEEIDTSPRGVTAMELAVKSRYRRIVTWKGLERLVMAMFIIDAALTLLAVGLLASAQGLGAIDIRTNAAFALSLQLIASIAESALVIAGVIGLAKSRRMGLRALRISALVSIFLVQVFRFFDDQLGAILNLAFDCLLLSVLNVMIAEQPADAD